MEVKSQYEDLIQAVSWAVLLASILVVLPLLLYGFLWLLALKTVYRSNLSMDLYAALWSCIAVFIALYHCRVAFKLLGQPESKRLIYMLATSALIGVSCPAWYSY